MGSIEIELFTTLDLVGQAPGGPEEDSEGGFAFGGWQAPLLDDVAGEQIAAAYEGTDALLLGRRTYDIFAGYWPNQSGGIAEVFNRVPKYVASRGTPVLSWETSIHVSDPAAEVPGLRERHQLIHTWGSANLLQTLWREGLVDQVNLWMCPVVLGKGKKVFPEGTAATRFEQLEPSRSFAKGLVLMRYRCLEGPPETVD